MTSSSNCFLREVWPDCGIFGNKISSKRSPNDWQLFWLFWKTSLLCKNCIGYFWVTFGKIGLLFTPTSGHTGGSSAKRKNQSALLHFLRHGNNNWEIFCAAKVTRFIFPQYRFTRSWAEKKKTKQTSCPSLLFFFFLFTFWYSRSSPYLLLTYPS